MYCNFFNNSERNLVVAGTSQLYVYRLNRDAEALTKNDGSTEGKAHREKLELVASFSFLAMSCPWPVCSLQAPNVMPCFSVSKTLSCLWWSMTQALMT